MSWALRFLGVGNAQAAPALGSASAVIERDGAPFLMIDCGQEALSAYLDRYGMPPRAICPACPAGGGEPAFQQPIAVNCPIRMAARFV